MLQKELHRIIRGNPLVLAKSKSIFGLVSMFLGGLLGLGFSGSYFKMDQWEGLIPLYIAFLCMSYWFGSGLKPITAVDGEGKSIYHFIRKGININHIFLAKCIVHTFITTTFLTVTAICIAWVFNLSLSLFLTVLIFGICIATTTGVIQVGSSAIYPRFNWEHYYEIGYSPKAELLENIFSAVYGILSIQCLTIGLVILYKKYKLMSFPITLQVINICIIILSAVSIATMIAMIKKHGIKKWEGM
jgi:ABC-2 type transport system permease protein